MLGREVIQALKHLQHAPGKTVIFVGVLEKISDEFNVNTWQPQMEGSNAKPRKAVETPAAATPAWASSQAPAPASGGVPWANQGAANQGAAKPQGAAAPGPAWLNG